MWSSARHLNHLKKELKATVISFVHQRATVSSLVKPATIPFPSSKPLSTRSSFATTTTTTTPTLPTARSTTGISLNFVPTRLQISNTTSTAPPWSSLPRSFMHLHKRFFSSTSTANNTTTSASRAERIRDLVGAAEEGRLQDVQRILAADSSILNEMVGQGQESLNALMISAQNGHTDVLAFLLAQPGIDVNKKGINGYTALLASIIGAGNTWQARTQPGRSGWQEPSGPRRTIGGDYLACTRMLLDHGANIEARIEPSEFTPLILAAQYGLTQQLLLLLSRGADINARGKNQETAFIMSAHFGKIDCAQILISQSKDVATFYNQQDKNGFSFATVAQQRNSPAMKLINAFITKQLQQGWQGGSSGGGGGGGGGGDIIHNTPLMFAAASGDMYLVNKALQQQQQQQSGEYVNEENILGQTALSWSLMGAPDMPTRIAIIEKLLEAGANANIADFEGMTPIFLTYGMDKQVSRVLLEKGKANINHVSPEDGSTPLIHALAHHQINVDTVLMWINEYGANIEATLPDGMNCLMLAAMHGHAEVVRVLLEKRPDMLAAKHAATGYTPLMFSISRMPNFDIMRMLLDHGAANPNDQAVNGISVLMLAVHVGDEAAIQYLLSKGANPNLADENGSTPLTVAALAGRVSLVRLLLNAGADPSIRDKEGDNVLDFLNKYLPAEHQNKEVVDLIKSRINTKAT